MIIEQAHVLDLLSELFKMNNIYKYVVDVYHCKHIERNTLLDILYMQEKTS